jgi:hypothetical protein
MGKQSRAKRARQSLTPIQATPSESLRCSPIWSILKTLSMKVVHLIQFIAGRVSAFTDWLAEKIHVSSKWAATGAFSFFTGTGLAMIGVNEYFAAMVCWGIAAVVCLSKAIHWQGSEAYPRLTVPGKIVWVCGSLAFFVLSYNWTQIKRGNEAWSSFIAPNVDTQTARPPEAPTAIYMECMNVPLPIKIPPHSTADIIPINKKRMQSVKWGFYEASNHSDKEEQWPEQNLMDKAEKRKDNFGLFTWRCEMSNHGITNVLDIKMPISFNIEKETIAYEAIITPLDAGAKFLFYPVNDCPEFAIAIWPDDVELQVFGESNRRKIRLHRTYKNSVEQIMMFSGSTVRLLGDIPCE